MTFIQCCTNVEDDGPTLYKCYTNVLCFTGRRDYILYIHIIWWLLIILYIFYKHININTIYHQFQWLFIDLKEASNDIYAYMRALGLQGWTINGWNTNNETNASSKVYMIQIPVHGQLVINSAGPIIQGSLSCLFISPHLVEFSFFRKSYIYIYIYIYH